MRSLGPLAGGLDLTDELGCSTASADTTSASGEDNIEDFLDLQGDLLGEDGDW